MMKTKIFPYLIPIFLSVTVLLSSCTPQDYKIYTLVPDNAALIGSFSPGKLMEKADAKDFEFIKKAIDHNEFNKALFENPGMTGIDVNSNSCFFMFGTDQKYLGYVIPVKNKKVFELFLDYMAKEFNDEFVKVETGKYTYSKRANHILAWNKYLLIYLRQIKGWDGSTIEGKLDELFSLEDEKCILSEKDFKSFLSGQKDINLWLTSNQIGSLGEINIGMLNMLGAINNNYGHIYLEFQDGGVVLSSNFRLNPDFKKSIDKFNFIDLYAEKGILKMLPAEDLILAGNFRLNPEKMLSLIDFFNSGTQKFLDEIEKETGRKPVDVLKSIHGSMAFSVNGIIPLAPNPTAKSSGKQVKENIPAIVAALQFNDEKIFNDFIGLLKQKEPHIEKNGYYVIKTEGIPFYLMIKNKVVILSNVEKYISEIYTNGEIKNSLFSLDISKYLVDNPICFYMNLDKESYTDKVKNLILDEMNQNFPKGMENFGAPLKSLTIIGNIEKTELRIELKDKSVNSLHAILKSMDH